MDPLYSKQAVASIGERIDGFSRSWTTLCEKDERRTWHGDRGYSPSPWLLCILGGPEGVFWRAGFIAVGRLLGKAGGLL